MSILDIFTFKKDIAQVFSHENVKNILEAARSSIIFEIKSNIPGQDKKNIVDAIVIARVDELAGQVKNKLVLWLVDQVKNLIPTVTQLVYEFLKEKVENL